MEVPIPTAQALQSVNDPDKLEPRSRPSTPSTAADDGLDPSWEEVRPAPAAQDSAVLSTETCQAATQRGGADPHGAGAAVRQQ